jgi:hypothetical protein
MSCGSSFHSDIQPGDIHKIHDFEYADDTARNNATGLTSDDIGKVAHQLDQNSFWVLVNDSPLEWCELTNKTIPPNVDVKVAVSNADTTSAFLEDKVQAGTNITITKQNTGSNESLLISSTDTNTDEQAKVSANDTTSGFLLSKVTAGTNVTITEVNDGGNETLQISSTDTNTDELSKVSANDTTSGFLLSKIVAGSNVTISEVNDGGNETLQVSANIPTSQLPIVNSFASLPGSPSTGEQVYYSPFNSVMAWDGSDWVGPKIDYIWFGRRGSGSFPLWMNSIDRVEVSPVGGISNAIYIPELSAGNGYKLYNISAKSDQNLTGNIEIHANSTSVVPNFGSTGVGLTSFSNNQFSDTELGTPGIINANDNVQCYLRRTGGNWNDIVVVMVMSRIARAP